MKHEVRHETKTHETAKHDVKPSQPVTPVRATPTTAAPPVAPARGATQIQTPVEIDLAAYESRHPDPTFKADRAAYDRAHGGHDFGDAVPPLAATAEERAHGGNPDSTSEAAVKSQGPAQVNAPPVPVQPR